MANLLSGAFAAFRHRDYRYWWLGQSVTLIGSNMQSAALAWLIYKLTGSATLLGTLATFRLGPIILLALPAGAFIDRMPKRRVLIATQTVLMLQALAVSLLVYANRASYPLILALSVVSGVAQAFDAPCRRSFLVDLVGHGDLTSAVSLNSSLSSIASIIGPSIAGVAMAELGANWCFLLAAIAYAPVILALLSLSTDGRPSATPKRRSDAREMLEGVRYIWRSDVLRPAMGMALVVFIFALNHNVIVPVFSDSVLGGDVRAYGNLMSVIGIGSFLGSLASAAAGRHHRHTRDVIVFGLSAGVVLILLSMSRVYLATAGLLLAFGFTTNRFANASNLTLQSNVDPAIIGRVMGAYAIIEMGTMPPGNALTGAIVDRFGPRMGFLLTGLISTVLLGALMVGNRRVTARRFAAMNEQG